MTTPKYLTNKVDHLDNYHLTWSYSAANPKYEQHFDAAVQDMPVAVVFRTPSKARLGVVTRLWTVTRMTYDS